MKLSKIVTLSLAMLAMLAVGQLVAEDAAKVDLSEIKCPISGKAVDPQATAEHHKATVYFCCNNCKAAFEKEAGQKKFAAKANHQLVATKQAKQKACPLSGKDVNPEKTLKVAGVKVAFCCGNCQGAAKSKEKDARIDLVFGKKAFKKGFEVVKKD